MAEANGRRRSGVLAGLLVSGAVAAAVAARPTWWTQAHQDALAGSITTRATGAATDPLLVPVALIALAGLGAALATIGWLRRLVGAVLVIGGGWAAALAVTGAVSAPASLQTDLTRPADSSGTPQLHAVGPVSGVLGGVLVLIAGALLLAGFAARQGLGSRYEPPTGRRGPAGSGTPGGDADVESTTDPGDDPEAAARWWKALDAGQDPTESGVATGPAAAVTDSTESSTDAPDAEDPGVSRDTTRGS